MFKEGEEIEAKVLFHNIKKRRIELGLKQKSSNPWEDLRVNYGEGGTINAEITNIIEHGAFVKIADEIEGFCHISQLSVDKIEKCEDAVKIGEKYNFFIQQIDEGNKKVSLSIKEYFKNQDRKNIEKYMSNETGTKTVTIADLLKD